MATFIKKTGKSSSSFTNAVLLFLVQCGVVPDTSETLLSPGRVEQLVREGRPPLRMGSIGTPGKEMQPFYQIPPFGFHPKKIYKATEGLGCIVFIYHNGKSKIGSTFTLTDQEAEQVEQRKKAERKRIGITEETDFPVPKDLEYYLDAIRQTRLMQFILPSERQKRASLIFAQRFNTIKDQLQKLDCKVKVNVFWTDQNVRIDLKVVSSARDQVQEILRSANIKMFQHQGSHWTIYTGRHWTYQCNDLIRMEE